MMTKKYFTFLFISIQFLIFSYTYTLHAQDEWHQVYELFPETNPYILDDDFGYSVAIDGDFMIVGIPGFETMSDMVPEGMVNVFRKVDDQWQPIARLTTSSRNVVSNFGHSIAISGDYILVGAYSDNDNKGAAYIYKKPASGWVDMTETAKFIASDGKVNDQFGFSVDIDNTNVVIGANLTDDDGQNSGSAYIFEKPETGWVDMTETLKITSSDAQSNDYFGFDVSVSENTVVVGSLYDDDLGDLSGSAYVYELIESQWQEKAKLTASDGAANNFLGRSVSILDNIVVLSADGKNNGNGAVYVYVKSSDHWVTATETAILTASNTTEGSKFGIDLDIYTNTIAVSAFNNDVNSSLSGQAYVFERPETGWTNSTESAQLIPLDNQENNYFGRSIAVTEDFLMVGGKQIDTDKGVVYEFQKQEATWTGFINESNKLYIYPYGHAEENEFGRAVAMDGDYAVIGAPENSANGPSQGVAFVYKREELTWVKVAKLTSSNLSDFDEFGHSVAISGNTIVVGAIGENTATGAAYVYEKPAEGWHDMNENAILRSSTGGHYYRFGNNVAVSEDLVVIGTAQYIFTTNNNAYVFEKPESGWEDMFETAVLSFSGMVEDEGFGIHITVHNDVIAVGATTDNGVTENSGSAYIFEKPIEGWTDMNQTAKLVASDGESYDFFGASLALNDQYLVVGATSDSGAAYIFKRGESGWVDSNEIAKLTASDADVERFFGFEVDFSGDYVVVGVKNDNDNGTESGSVYMFEKPENGWENMTETFKLLPTNGFTGDNFGNNVSVSGNLILVGANFNDEKGNNSGKAYFFTNNLPPKFINGAIEDQTFQEDEVDFEIEDLNTVFTDPENQPLSYDINSNNENIAVILNNTNLKISATENYFGEADIEIHVTDGENNFNTSFHVTILPVNDDPTDIILSNTNISEGQTAGFLVGSFTSEDVDIEDVHSYQFVDGEENNDNSLFLIDGNQLLTNTDIDYESQNTFVIRVQTDDHNGGLLEKDFEILVLDINEVPSFVKGADIEILEDAGEQIINNWATGIHDGDNGTQQITFIISNNNNSLFSGQPVLSETGTLLYESAPNAFGEAIITLSLSDNGGTENGGVDTSEEQSFKITVLPVNDSPQILSTAPLSATEDILYTYAVSVADPDDANNGTDLLWSLENEPEGMSINAIGEIQWTPLDGVLTSGAVMVTVADGGEDEAVAASETFTITVTAVNDLPIIDSIDDLSLCQGETGVVELGSITSDEEYAVEELTFTASTTTPVEGLDLIIDEISQQLLIINNTESENTTLEILVEAEDLGGAKGAQTFNLNLLYKEIAISQDDNILTATEGLSYQWFRDGIVISESAGGTLQTIQASEVGKYQVAVEFITGCIGVSEEIEIDALTKIEFENISDQIKIYPNPVAKMLYVEASNLEKGNLEINIYNILGKLVMKKIVSSNQVDISSLAKGVYQVQMIYGEKYIGRKRFVKK